jgi:hypothetical protein
MQDDVVQILLYVVIGVIGVIASAYQNKQKRKQAGSLPPVKRMPRDILAEPDRDFEPSLGPLMEVFDIPRMSSPQPADESVESGPSVEEGGMLVDTQESAAELAGMKIAEEAKSGEVMPVKETLKKDNRIYRSNAKYDAIQKELARNMEKMISHRVKLYRWKKPRLPGKHYLPGNQFSSPERQ